MGAGTCVMLKWDKVKTFFVNQNEDRKKDRKFYLKPLL